MLRIPFHVRFAVACTAGLLVALRPLPASAFRIELPEAVGRALTQGGKSRRALLATERASHEAQGMRSEFRPRLSVSSGAGYSSRQTEKLRAVDGRGVERVYGLASLGSREGWFNVFAEQLLFDLRRSKQIEAADLAVEVTKAVEAQERQAVALEVFELYTDVLRLDERLRMSRQVASRAKALAELASSLAAAGAALDVDREDARIAAQRAALAVEDLERRRAIAQQSLAAAIGAGNADLPEPVAGSLPAVGDGEVTEVDDRLLAETPELRALEARRRLEHARVEAAHATRLPTVGVQGGYSHYGTNRYDNFPDEWRIGVDVRVPLFDGGKTRHETAAARNDEQIATIQYELALARKRRLVGELRARLAAAGRQEELAASSAANAQRRLDLVEMRLRAKRGGVLEVVSALDRYRAASAAAIDARFERLRAWARLESELARLVSKLLPEASE